MPQESHPGTKAGLRTVGAWWGFLCVVFDVEAGRSGKDPALRG